jgi:hypothetical protein
MTRSVDSNTLTSQADRDGRLACGGWPVNLQNVKLRLDAWRDAERRRDGIALGSLEWQDAEDEVRSAEKAYHAELAQASARYAEAEFQGPNPGWPERAERLTERAAD